MSKSKRIVGPFQSEYGTFNPGDQAIAITVCRGRVGVTRVEYVGYVERRGYNYHTRQMENMKYAQVRRPIKSFTPFFKGTDTVAKWPYGDQPVEYRYVDKHIITTLQYNRLLPATASTDNLIAAM